MHINDCPGQYKWDIHTLMTVLKYMAFGFKDSHMTNDAYESSSVKPQFIISLMSIWFLNSELREIFKWENFKLKLSTWDNRNRTLTAGKSVSSGSWCSIVHTHADMSPQFYAVVVSKAFTIFINHMYVCNRQVTPSKLR